MKQIAYISLIFILLLGVSCKKEKTVDTDKNIEVKSYLVDTKNSVINWTAYKTTEKIPVKGVFKEVRIVNETQSANPAEVLNNLEFEIPVASIFSNDSIRDHKLLNFFFGVMENTLHIKGKFSPKENGQGLVHLTMNGLTKELPFFYEVQGDKINMNAIMNIDQWEGQTALKALNEVCLEQHKAADGISKTWNEVTLNIQIATKLAE
ncbi:MAG: YceI family protein [Flavobacteriaceae bacterium]|nr:YceI family protein [Flavobacteriaceae bacterium]